MCSKLFSTAQSENSSQSIGTLHQLCFQNNHSMLSVNSKIGRFVKLILFVELALPAWLRHILYNGFDSSPPVIESYDLYSHLTNDQMTHVQGRPCLWSLTSGTPSDFGIILPLAPVLKKIAVTRKIWEKAGVKFLRDLTEKSVNFSTLATSNIRLLLVFGEEDQ